jgi:hypothetical protein
MARQNRFGIGSVIVVVLGLLAGYLLIREVAFGFNAVASTAKVESYVSSRGKGKARVVHEVEGQPVKATLSTWFYPLHEGQRVPILYLPDQPSWAERDSFWQRYLPLGMGLVFFGVGAVFEVARLLRRRRDIYEGVKPAEIAEPL